MRKFQLNTLLIKDFIRYCKKKIHNCNFFLIYYNKRMKMALDQFGIGGIGGLFEQAQTQAQAPISSGLNTNTVDFGGGLMDSGAEMTPDIQTPSTGGTTSTVAGQPAISNFDAMRKDLLEATESTYNPTSSPMPGLIPKINQNPLQGLQFFLNMLAMQDTAEQSQGKVKGLMSGIQTLIKNEFPNADFEGGMGVKKTFDMGIF